MVKLLFPFAALKGAFIVLYIENVVQKLERTSTVNHEKKGTCFYYMESDKSWPQHIQTAVGASGRKSGGGNFYPQRGVYLTDKVG